MTKSTKWALGIAAVVGLLVILWYGIFSPTGMFWRNSEVTATTWLSPPKDAQIALPDVSSRDVDRLLRELQESQRREPMLGPRIKGSARLSDDPRLEIIDCECGCGIVLADCDCEDALRQIEALRTTKENIE